ncbi:MAG: twin-arginine translocase TatA/TatE family subunit [Dehalococcoidia bacterium]
MPIKVGPTEILIVIALIAVVFGVRRIPEVGSALGKAIRGFHQGVTGNHRDEPARRGDG